MITVPNTLITDFSKGTRGAVSPAESGKTRITIRIDNDILEYFRGRVDEQGGGNYQTMIIRYSGSIFDRTSRSRRSYVK